MERPHHALTTTASRRNLNAAPLVDPDQLTFTIVTAANKQPLAKKFSLDKTGKLTTKTAATLTRGTVTVEHAVSLADFAARLDHLETHQAVMYGIPPTRQARVVTLTRFAEMTTDQRKGVITRTREYLQFASAPGVMMLDFDYSGAAGGALAALASPDAVRNLLIRAAPELADAPMLWRPSSSSYIYRGKREVQGLRGQRIYIPVTRASDIPRLGKLLYERLWLSGHGYFVMSASGRLLDRTAVDGSVWQPERLDFAAGPICTPPLTRRLPKVKLWNPDAPFFDARCVANLSPQDERSIAAKRKAARAVLHDAARARREAWAKERGKEIVARNGGISEEAAIAVACEAVEHRVLRPEFLLTTEDVKEVTVREVLAHPEVWHGKRFCDPLEPTYRDDHRIAYANLRPGTGRPYLFSHAHGGVRYILADTRPTIRLVQGNLTQIVDACTDVISAEGDIYQLKDEIVRLTDENRLAPVTPEWITDYLQRRADFERFLKGGGWVPADLSAKYAKTLLAKSGELSLPSLVALTSGPFLRPDGTVVDQAGYDVATQVLYQPSGPNAPAVRGDVTPAMATEALRYLWAPFSEFPFAEDVDRGVILALLLTAAIRPGIAIAPAGLIESHDAGSGKTLAAQAIANLTGVPAAPQAMALNEEEVRKALFAVARAGIPALFFDNVARERPVDSASLAMVLTSGILGDRILGESVHARVPFRSLMLLTGNNVRIVGDLNRRILRARITPNVEHPWQRVFAFCPRARTEASWLDLRVAALEIVRASLGGGSMSLPAGSGYPEWDRLVREPVCWVAQHLDIGIGFADPVETLLSGFEDDPERDRLRRLFMAWHGAFKAEPQTLAQVFNALNSGVLPQSGETSSASEEAMQLLREVLHEIDHHEEKHKIGIYLNQQQGRIVEGLELINAGRRSGVSLWSVRRRDAAGVAA